MAFRVPRRWRLVAAGAGAVLLVLGAGAAAVVLSGAYNVAASRDHFWITRLIIELALDRSVSLRSTFVPAPPDLDDPDLIRLGAAHYQGECALCHGEPGRPRNPIVTRMLPQPPFFGDGVRGWTRDEQFWIAKHGLKMTGMPAFVSLARDDEVWAVIAFLQKLPMPRAQYLRLARGHATPPETTARDVVEAGDTLALTQCARCHDSADAAPLSRHVPRLAGQSEAYLLRAIGDYAVGRRDSGIMQPVAGALTADESESLARYYARLAPAAEARTDAQPAQAMVARGADIAMRGVRGDGIPPCLACHGPEGAAVFPRLAGQYAPYIRTQLRLWQQGLRDRSGYGEIMATIARRLSEEQIDAVAAYFASLPPFGAAPATGNPGGRP